MLLYDDDGDLVTGEAGNLVDTLEKNNATTAESVTIAESSNTNGKYQCSFTPADGGNGVYYQLRVTHATYNTQGWYGEFEVLEHDNQSIGADVDDVLADTNEMQGKLPTNNIMGSSVKTDKDDEIDDILVDTDTMEADLKTYMDTKETNIIVEIDANETKIDALQTDLDNPNQYKADVSALAIEANVEGHVTDALNTYDPPTRTEATADKDAIITEVNANETKIDSIITTLSTLVADIWSYATRTLTSFGTLITNIWGYATRTLTGIGTSGIASESNATSNKNAIESAISTSESNIRGADNDNLKDISDQIDGLGGNGGPNLQEIEDHLVEQDTAITGLPARIWRYVDRGLNNIQNFTRGLWNKNG